MRVLVTGADGQLGRAIVNCKSDQHEVFGYTKEMCDVINRNRVKQVIQEVNPDIVIHCAAYTAVDAAEEETMQCRQVNIDGTRNVVDSCKLNDIAFMLLSTDYVFSGTGIEPYEVDADRNPLNQYGLSKVEAENIAVEWKKHYIVRTSWIFGDGENFVRTIASMAAKQKKIKVVNDQFGSPTYAEDLAPTLLKLASTKKYGTYHATNEGVCTWAELAQFIVNERQMDTEIIPVTSSEYNSPAKRPHNSRMSKAALKAIGFECLPTWQDAVSRYLKKWGESMDA